MKERPVMPANELKPCQKKHYATWSLSLDVECPECGEYFDLTDDDDFWDGGKMSCCEHNTPSTTDVRIECPKCEHEFLVDFDY